MTDKSSKNTARYVMSIVYCIFGLAVVGIYNFWKGGERVLPKAVPIVAVIVAVTFAVVLFVQKRKDPDFGIEAFYQLSIGFAIGSGIMGILVMNYASPILGLLFFITPCVLPLILHLCDLLIRVCMKENFAGRMDGKLKVSLKEPVAASAFAATAVVVALTFAATIGLFIVQPRQGFATLAFIAPLAVVPFVLFLVRKQIRDLAFLFGVTFGFIAILSGMPVFERMFYLVDGGVIIITAFAICCLFAAIMLALIIRQSVRNSRARRELNTERNVG